MTVPLKSGSKSILATATAIRQLARDTPPGEFQTRLLMLAREYEQQAARLEGQASVSELGGPKRNQCD